MQVSRRSDTADNCVHSYLNKVQAKANKKGVKAQGLKGTKANPMNLITSIPLRHCAVAPLCLFYYLCHLK
jgi:hypothetical protein